MSTDLILIADGNVQRGQRVYQALEAAGHICRFVQHGAAALEVALSETPTVLVAQADLPLVDASKLAEILRANPRTRSARFLFLGREIQGSVWAGGVGDTFLDAKSDVDEVIDTVEVLIDRQIRIEGLEARASGEREFEGCLSDLSPAEIVQMLHARGATGRLTLASSAADGSSPSGFLLLTEGEVYAAEAGPARAEKAVFRMLDWHAGDFHFEPCEAGGAHEIRTPTRSLLAEGLRQLEEWQRLAQQLPPLESPVSLCVDRAELPHIIHPLTQDVLSQLETASRVSDVMDECAHPDYQVLRTLRTLEDRGIVRFGRSSLAPPEVEGGALFTENQVRRLRGFVQAGENSAARVPDAKLLVVAANEAVVGQFANLMKKVPGTELSPRLERGDAPAGSLEPVARLDVDGDFAIEMIHVPAGPAFEPIWNFAGHGALGTIFLLDAKVGSSVDGLTPVTEALTGQPGARTFHVVLLADGERLSPDDLRANLSLMDEASLFLLPLEDGKDPSSLLRSLFARIVP
ncbi:MAG: DUF4388 domain-containing protein [Myxococcota bacterium]